MSKALTELLAPAPNCLIGDGDAALRQKQLDVPEAEAEHVIEPHGVADDLSRKPMAVNGVGRTSHAASFARPKLLCQIPAGLP